MSRDMRVQGSRLDVMDEGLRQLLLAPKKMTVEEAVSGLKTGACPVTAHVVMAFSGADSDSTQIQVRSCIL